MIAIVMIAIVIIAIVVIAIVIIAIVTIAIVMIAYVHKIICKAPEGTDTEVTSGKGHLCAQPSIDEMMQSFPAFHGVYFLDPRVEETCPSKTGTSDFMGVAMYVN